MLQKYFLWITFFACQFLFKSVLPQNIPNLSLLFQTIRVASDAIRFHHPRTFLGPDDFARAAISPVEIPGLASLNAMNMPDLFEGDIAGYTIDQMGYYRDDPQDYLKQPYNSALNLETYPDKLWPKGRIPYELSPDLSDNERTAVAQAFDEYKEKTCVQFVPKSSQDYDYIFITRNFNSGCSSYVGKAGGNQTVSLEIGKCFTKGIVAHELMHSLGFFHEHSRPDRDRFVEIVDNNIKPGMLRNFEKYPQKIIDTLHMPYDYESVMHYHQLAFSSNGKPTILPIDRSASIGQRYKLSDVDAEKVNYLYKCDKVAYGKKVDPSVPNLLKEKKPAKLQFTLTTTEPTTSTTEQNKVEKVESNVCKDTNEHCKLWADIGHCRWSEKYMAHYCKKSCDYCKPEPTPEEKAANCMDQNLFCGYWSRIGECETESKFMKIFCKKSCSLCDS